MSMHHVGIPRPISCVCIGKSKANMYLYHVDCIGKLGSLFRANFFVPVILSLRTILT